MAQLTVDGAALRPDAWQMPLRIILAHRYTARIAATLGILLILVSFGGALDSVRDNPYWNTASTDFGVYYQAAGDIANGDNPYFEEGRLETIRGYYGYPPAFAEALIPLHYAGEDVARYGWLLIQFACLLAAVPLLLRAFGMKLAWPWVLLATGIVAASYPAHSDFYHGQVNFPLLLLLVGGLALFVRGHERGAALPWAAMIVVKPFLGVLVLYLLWRREWKAALTTSAVTAGLLALSFARTFVNGFDAVEGWIRISRDYGSAVSTVQPDSHSLHALVLWLFTTNAYSTPWIDSQALLHVSTALLVLTLVAAFLIALPPRAMNRNDRTGARVLTESGFVLALGMTYGPLAEGDHLFLLLPAFVGVAMLAWRAFESGAAPSWWFIAGIAWVVLFAMVLSPIRKTLLVAPIWSPARPSGLEEILWTGRVGFALLFASVSTALALRTRSMDTYDGSRDQYDELLTLSPDAVPETALTPA